MNFIAIGSILGMLVVILGAFGAHGLKDILDDKCFSKIVVNDILEKNIIKKCDQLPYTG